MATVLIFSDKNNMALELLTAAREIGAAAIKAVTINDSQAAQELANAGAEVYNIDQPDLVLADAAAVASALAQAVEQLQVDTILLSSNRRCKEYAGRLAQIIGAGCLTDVTALQVNGGQIECQRNALGGATVATQAITAARQVIAIRPRTYEAAAAASGGSVNSLQVNVQPSAVKVLEVRGKEGDSVDIEAAEILVAVGQGMESKDDLPLAEELARKLGGEVACSKPLATDKKWLSEERVVGLSGKKCKPQLALLFGISGQVQFTVGIRDARVIVSVNTDENASINQMSDYILTADLKQVLADLNKAL
ncbi:MAG TPA: electron transfer flavoprotein subunit alpha/FixB family protein [Syntrophomonadaceae bacterium]|nr:electron transfer flavoprotein subunit alpha/FixB family protein [Syntrophomonadaceae bacterium]HQA08233.1 electron transfer flavoprotein subunit alpha/FixB family protein [Syntrophomonadaceae bacterium]HQE23461.1 electron transfer flavoprotein subunit alpha/FixB family protein [Syntrophomonadaceae bacterium]